MNDDQVMTATPHAELIAELMNPNIPKNEREHAAVREIERLRDALAQPDTDMAYTIALQRAIEWHCDGKTVPPDVAEVCPYHAEMLNKTLAQPVQPEQDVKLNLRRRTHELR